MCLLTHMHKPLACHHPYTATMASFTATSADLPSPAESAKHLRTLLPEALHRPVIAIVCGSGLAGLADLLEDRVDLEYTKIGFPSSTGACTGLSEAAKKYCGRLI